MRWAALVPCLYLLAIAPACLAAIAYDHGAEVIPAVALVEIESSQAPNSTRPGSFEAFLWQTLRSMPVDEADRSTWEQYKQQLGNLIVGQPEVKRIEQREREHLHRLIKLAQAEKELAELKRRAARAAAEAEKAAREARAAATDAQSLSSLRSSRPPAPVVAPSAVQSDGLSYEQKVAKVNQLVDDTFAAIKTTPEDAPIMEKYKAIIKQNAMQELQLAQAKADQPSASQLRQKVEDLIVAAFNPNPPPPESVKPLLLKYARRAFLHALSQVEVQTGIGLLTQQERDFLERDAAIRKRQWAEERARREAAATAARYAKYQQIREKQQAAEKLTLEERKRHEQRMREKEKRAAEYEQWLASLPKPRYAEPDEDWEAKAGRKTYRRLAAKLGRSSKVTAAGGDDGDAPAASSTGRKLSAQEAASVVSSARSHEEREVVRLVDEAFKGLKGFHQQEKMDIMARYKARIQALALANLRQQLAAESTAEETQDDSEQPQEKADEAAEEQAAK